MAADKLQLGDFIFEIDDLPEGMDLGGDQMLAIIRYPGGHKEVQAFGAQDQNPSWSGTFNYYNALDKVRQLDKMYRSGDVYTLQIGPLSPRTGVIKTFKWTYRSAVSIDYRIELELAPVTSILVPSPASSNTSTTTPSTDAPAPQKTYIVVSGDSLWSIAAKAEFYGDGSQYRKIASANNILNPDQIQVGQKLVIP